jgi:flagellin
LKAPTFNIHFWEIQMSSTINTNISSIVSQNALNKTQRTMQKTMESLSTGSRINRASDDATGLAIAENMKTQINGLSAAVRNANDAISLLQTADSAMGAIGDMLQRMRELGVLAQNDTYSTSQRVAMNDEFVALQSEIDRVADNTQWNGMNLLDGTGGSWAGGSAFTFQIGANANQTITVAVPGMGTATLGISAVSIGTVADAQDAVTALDDAISVLNTRRSVIGSAINRLTYTVENLDNISQNAQMSRSTVADTDYAKATSELARAQILQQAGTAMLAQANQQPNMVLALLK